MKYLIAPILIFYSVSAQALNTTEFEVIKNLLTTEPLYPELKVTCGDSKDPESIFNEQDAQCARDLCGNPSDIEFSLYQEDINESTIKENPEVEKQFIEFRSKLVDYANARLTQAKKISDNILDSAKLDPTYFEVENLSPDVVSLILHNELDSLALAQLKVEGDSKVFKLENLTDFDINRLDGVAQQYLEFKKEEIENSFLDLVSQDIISFEDAKKQINQILKDALDRNEKLKVINVKDAAKNKNLLGTFREEINQAVRPTDFIKVYIDLTNVHSQITERIGDSYQKYDPPNEIFKCTGKDCTNALKTLFSSQYIKDLAQGLSSEAEIQEMDIPAKVDQCRNLWYLQDLMSAPKHSVDNLLKKLPTIKSKFIKNILPNISTDTRVKLNSFINDLEFQMPTVEGEEISGIKNLRDKINEYSNSIPSNSSTESDNNLPKFYNDFKKLNQFISPQGFYTFFPSIQENCIEQSFNSDSAGHSLTHTGSIRISGSVARYPKTGHKIIYHELAHAAGRFFESSEASNDSKEHYLKLRECVSELSKDSPPVNGQPFFEKDHRYTEEDMADIISFQVPETSQGPLMSCSFIGLDKRSNKWINATTSRHAHGEATHSPGLLRAIREASYRGKLIPPSCLNAIESRRDEVDTKICK